MKYILKDFLQLNETTYQVILFPEEEHFLQFTAGQYVFLRTGLIEHPYSIANAPSKDGHLEFLIRSVSGDHHSQALLDYVRTHRNLEIKGPYGNCIYSTQYNKPILLLAGGIGFAQIKSIMEQAVLENDPRYMHLIWNASDMFATVQTELLLKWLIALPRFHYTLMLSRTHALWRGKQGRIANFIKEFSPDLFIYQAYISGPWTFVDAVVEELLKYGIKKDFIYSDRFSF